MKNKEYYTEEYLNHLYGEVKNDIYYNEDRGQSRIDFIAGFNLAEELFKPKWIDVRERLPETWCQHTNIYESDEVLLDCGDFYVVSRYVNHSDKGVKKFDNVEDQEIVLRWIEIPQ